MSGLDLTPCGSNLLLPKAIIPSDCHEKNLYTFDLGFCDYRMSEDNSTSTANERSF